MKKPLVLCILDGCGMRENSDGNAFKNAHKPIFDELWQKYPHCLLEASGVDVGLPTGQMGNSEVGHMNIGAGRIVYQPLELINRSLQDNSLFENEELIKVINSVKENKTVLHVMGLLSDGGVHSHIGHLLGLIDIFASKGIENVYYHLFLDGRDTAPKSALKYVEMLEKKIEEVGFGTIATVSGRYYAMDRDDNYDRVQPAYDAIVKGEGPRYTSVREAIEENYRESRTDEFVMPSIISPCQIEDGDAILTFNFRRDRLRELFTALTDPLMSPLKTKDVENLQVLTMLPVTNTVKCPHVFDNPDLSDTMGKYLSEHGLSQLRIAETEKYAHVTYFYDGGIEEELSKEKKILIPSPKVATYDLKPQMSAQEVTDVLIGEHDKDVYDVVILNYANGDMVGHTGNYEAAKEAIEFLDGCLSRLFQKIEEKDGTLIVTADHGNSDMMWDEEHKPVTSHTTSRVPFIITKNGFSLRDGRLSDIAPTMLELLHLEKPISMTGESLIENKFYR